MQELKEKAIDLRRRGFSYKMIKDKLGVSKSTLNGWLSLIPYKPNQEVIRRIGLQRIKTALSRQKIKFDSIEEARAQARSEIGSISKRDLLMLGIGLYLGEGEKSFENVRITNSDPKIIHLAIRWFSEVCGAKIENFSPALHLYPDSNISETMKYWSEQTSIPISQFKKTIIDTRKNKSDFKKRKLPYGTLHLRVNGLGEKRLGVFLHRKICAWIEECVR